jgi:hypothetical protein
MNAMSLLTLAVGWALTGLLSLLGLIILYYMWRGKINLAKLIAEPQPPGDASLSRFQFLVFTFVIAMSYLLVVVGTVPPTFPDIPPGVLALLGISSVSYMVSKSLQTSRDTQLEQIHSKERTEAAQSLAPSHNGTSETAKSAVGKTA